jgi:hypothetical protein
MVEVTSGLGEGDLVVSRGTHRLRDGAPVTVAGASQPERVAAAGQGA